VVPEASLTPDALAAIVRQLLADPSQRQALAAAAQRLLPRDAADRLAVSLLDLAGRPRAQPL
jgi:UDP-N-acetylglucosamine:LPS N-acetylglucosamine transferase